MGSEMCIRDRKKLTENVVLSTLQKLHEKRQTATINLDWGLKEELKKQNYDTEDLGKILKKLRDEGKIKQFANGDLILVSWYEKELAKRQRKRVLEAISEMSRKGEYSGIQNLLGNEKLIGMAREEHLLKALKNYGISEERAKEIIGELMREGKIFEPRRGFYRIVEEEPKAIASYNKATGWLSIKFEEKPSNEVLRKLRDAGFRYEPKSRIWRASWTIQREELLKEIAGEIETVEKETNYAKLVQKHLKLAEKYEKEAQYHYDRYKGISSAIPLGQPILVGHYSEKYHRKDLERIRKHQAKYVEAKEKAKYHKERAEHYAKLAFKGEDVKTVYNRIKRLETDRRRWEDEIKFIELEKGMEKEGYFKRLGVRLGYKEDEVKTLYQRTLERLEHEKAKFRFLTGKSFEEYEKERKEASKKKAIEKRKQKIELPFKLKIGDIVESPFGKAKVVKINPKTVVVEKEGYQFKVRKDMIGKAS